jgi:signal transduction histidine kinase
MGFRVRYSIYILFLHGVIVLLTYQLLKSQKILFLAAEVLIIISAFAGMWLLRRFTKPHNIVAQGIETIRNKDFTVRFVPTGYREVDELIDVYNQMIGLLSQERTRQQEQQFFLDKLLEASPIPILVFDFDGRLSAANPGARKLLGQRPEELIGKTPREIDHPLLNQLDDSDDETPRILRTNGIQTYKVNKAHFIDRGFRRSFLMIEELTHEIVDTEKKAYSKVIRMMAHEVNNSIGAINSILDVTVSHLPAEGYDEIRHALHVAIERNRRLSGFMHRFAEIVRLPPPHKRPADLGELVANVSRLMQSQAAVKGVHLELFTDAQPVVREVDVEQFEQMLINVVKNAVEACVAGNSVEVRLGPERLVVRNNGNPIPPAVAANLFKPFFSTKPDGQGIGLTLTRDILMGHGFPFSLQSHPDGWTAFTVELNEQ